MLAINSVELGIVVLTTCAQYIRGSGVSRHSENDLGCGPRVDRQPLSLRLVSKLAEGIGVRLSCRLSGMGEPPKQNRQAGGYERTIWHGKAVC